MVNTHRHSDNRKAGHEEGRGAKRREDETTRKTQWCSGITCVLAGLRAHYPEHQHKKEEEEKEEDREKRKTSNKTTHPHTTHRHSTTHNTTQ